MSLSFVTLSSPAPLLGMLHTLSVMGSLLEHSYLLAEVLGRGAIPLGVAEATEGCLQEGVGGVNEISVGFTTLAINNGYKDANWRSRVFNCSCTGAWVGKLPGHDLNFKYSE